MLRSLSSSITGLQNHQTQMDVIGNNIANVNTVAYKSERVTFEESFSQLLEGASRPPGDSGGTNPLQVGSGMSVGSIDTLMTQGNLDTTGRTLDLAIEGESYYAVADGNANYYTRNGSFQLDSQGNVVLSTNGMILQGKMANNEGEFPAGTTIGDITIPYSEQSPAKATQSVSFSDNLNSESDAQGSVIYSQSFLHHAQGTDDLRALRNSTGEDIGMEHGDVITISAYIGGSTTLTEATFVVGTGVGEISTMDELASAISTTLGWPGSVTVVDNPADPYNGSLNIVPSAQVDNLQVTSDNPLSNAYLNQALNVSSRMSPLTSYYTDTMRSPAESSDLVSELYDANGDALGLEDGDAISITGLVGDETINSDEEGLTLTYDSALTTMNDILVMTRDTLKLPLLDGTVLENPTVSMNAGGSDDGIPDGSLVVRGAKGEDFALTNITIRATDSNNQTPTPTLFNSNMSFSVEQKAKDVGVFDTSITIYDDTGEEHVLTMTYVHTGEPGVWDWSISLNGNETITQGARGEITFGQDGSVASFTFDDDSSQLVVNPNNGSSLMRIALDVGGPGDFQGITQFSSETTVSAVAQDGYTTGSLDEISIDEFGYIEGTFSNGTSRRLAQIMLVDFTNPSGLLRMGDSIYAASANSGDPVFGAAGTQSSSVIKPGALEMSNVDLATEFTEMIVTQRGYQANSRVITVSDSMLEELVSLKR